MTGAVIMRPGEDTKQDASQRLDVRKKKRKKRKPPKMVREHQGPKKNPGEGRNKKETSCEKTPRRCRGSSKFFRDAGKRNRNYEKRLSRGTLKRRGA